MNIRQLVVVGLLSFGIVSIEAARNERQVLNPREQLALLRQLKKEERKGTLSPQNRRRLAVLQSAMAQDQKPVADQQHNFNTLPPRN